MAEKDRARERTDLEKTVDDLEEKHVSAPDPDQKIDPASATHEGADDIADDRAGNSEPPD